MPELTFYSRLPYVYNTFGEVCRNTHFSAATLRPSLELFLPKFIVKKTPDGGAPWRQTDELTFYSSHVVANHSILLFFGHCPLNIGLFQSLPWVYAPNVTLETDGLISINVNFGPLKCIVTSIVTSTRIDGTNLSLSI